jgi:hypothetical protein
VFDPETTAMLVAVLIIAAAAVGAVLASRFMWWATSRSPMWAMAAGALLLAAICIAGVFLVWWSTSAMSGR